MTTVHLRYSYKVEIDDVDGKLNITVYRDGTTTFGIVLYLPKLIWNWERFVREYTHTESHEILHVLIHLAGIPTKMNELATRIVQRDELNRMNAVEVE